MNNNIDIESYAQLGSDILSWGEDYQRMSNLAFAENGWFTENEIQRALTNIAEHFLSKNALTNWSNQYVFEPSSNSATVGLIFSGNLPAVGFHDLLCGLFSPHHLKIKLSTKDKVILPFLVNKLIAFGADISERIEWVERLSDFDAVIATGGENASKVFKEYFHKVPNIIRGHRNSLAILDGAESEESLKNLGHDLFDFFGLGCRNVSKIFVPEGYDWRPALKIWETHFSHVSDHHKYRNNYDYNLALYLLNKREHLLSQNLVLVPDSSMHSRIACCHFEEYSNLEDVKTFISMNSNHIQCVISEIAMSDLDRVEFGKGQTPGLFDYADHIDVMTFLSTFHGTNQ